MNRYRLLYRPASFCTLPSGVGWRYADVRRYGDRCVIETDRPLTAEEMRTFEIETAE